MPARVERMQWSLQGHAARLAPLWLLIFALAPDVARAAEVTDVLDAFDDAFSNPYDFSLRLRFAHDARSAGIAREVRCIANDAVGSQICPTQSRTIFARELEYSSSRQTLNIDARVGLFHDVELAFSLPMVVGYSWSHAFANGVSRSNSTLLPPDNRDAVMAVPYKSVERSGLGDAQLGLKWSPYNYYRDHSKPTWVFAINWTLPTGEPMKAENDTVGLGLHQVDFSSTISRRALRILEPFFAIHATMFFETKDSLFAKQRQPETHKEVTPGTQVGTRFGGELIPWEDLKNDARIELEAGFAMDYNFRGRAYSEVWEALASPSNPCRLSASCSNISHTKSDPDPTTGRAAMTNGITDVEQYGTFAGWASLHYQPVRHFQISAMFRYSVDTPHFITFGDYGVSLDDNKAVEQANSQTPPKNEYSPEFLPSLDSPGSRLRLQDVANISFMLSVSGKL